jgi:hypothetical protein
MYLQQLFACLSVLATSTLASPLTTTTHSTTLPSGLQLHNLAFRGDGIYIAAFDDAGVASVEFTPLISPLLSRTPIAAGVSTKRDGLTGTIQHTNCFNAAPSSNVTELDMANEMVADSVERLGDGRGAFKRRMWGWVCTLFPFPFKSPYTPSIIPTHRSLIHHSDR